MLRTFRTRPLESLVALLFTSYLCVGIYMSSCAQDDTDHRHLTELAKDRIHPRLLRTRVTDNKLPPIVDSFKNDLAVRQPEMNPQQRAVVTPSVNVVFNKRNEEYLRKNKLHVKPLNKTNRSSKGKSQKRQFDEDQLKRVKIRNNNAQELKKANKLSFGTTRSNKTFLRDKKISNDMKKISPGKMKQSKMLKHSVLDQTLSFKSFSRYIHISSAHVDNRNGRFIRMVSIVYLHIVEKAKVICTFRNNISVTAEFYKTCEDHSRPFAAFLISCSIPKSVSDSSIWKHNMLVKTCNLLKCTSPKTIEVVRQIQQWRQKKDFGVCVPPLFNKVAPTKLAQFIELNKMLGASHFAFYDYGVDSDTNKMLRWYESMGYITVLPWKLPVPDNLIWYYGQSVSVWDCLLRNMNHFKLLAFTDLDEFIVPRTDKTWTDMVKSIKKTLDVKSRASVAAYRFKSFVFDNDLGNSDRFTSSPEFRKAPVLDTIWRNGVLSNIRTKLMVDPEKVFELGIHHLSKAMNDSFFSVDVHPNHAILHHYRTCKNDFGMRCKNATLDTIMWRYQTKLLHRVKHATKEALGHV